MINVHLKTDPFDDKSFQHFEVAPNQTINEILGGEYDVSVLSNGHIVPKEFFDSVRFKDGTTLEIKPITGVGAAIAIAATVGSFIAANSAWLVPLAVGIASGIASTLLAPEQPTRNTNSFTALNQITGTENQIVSFKPVPKLMGRFRYYPVIPITAKPYTEQVAENQYLRQYFVLSHGKMDIGGHIVGEGHPKITQDTKLEDVNGQRPLLLGETDIAEFGAEFEIGTPDLMTLYSDQVIEDSPDWTTSSDASDYGSHDSPTVADGDSTIRTTEKDVEEISIDVRGNIYTTDSKGNFRKIRVNYKIEWRETGTNGDWASDTFTLNGYGQQTATKNYRIKDIKKGQYDVRLTRVSTYFSNLEGPPQSDVTWSALRSIRKRKAFDPGDISCVVCCMRVKATDQLNGRIKKFSVQGTSVLPVYSDGQWSEQATRNPAWVSNEVMTGSANRSPISQSSVDLEELVSWAHDNDYYGLSYDALFDDVKTTIERLKEITTAGRATWTINSNTQFSFIRDIKPDENPRMMITPRNSFNYKYSLSAYNPPQCLKVKFTSDKTWQDDEVVVYSDGYDRSNATEIVSITAPGYTNPELAHKFGRYHLADMKLRGIETHSFDMDVHHLHFDRGSLVTLQNDSVEIGLGSGRVKWLELNEDNEIIGFESDEYLTLGDGNRAVQFQTANDIFVERIENIDGTSVRFKNPVDRDIPTDTQFTYGELGKITRDIRVREIEKKTDLQASITAEPAAPNILDGIDGPIPDFDPSITDPVDLENYPPKEPNIEKPVSDSSVAIKNDDGSLQYRLAVYVSSNSGRVATDHIEVQAQVVDGDDTGPWISHNARDGVAHFTDFEPGDIVNIRARALSNNGPVSTWVYFYNYQLTGRLPIKPTGVDVERRTFSIKITPIGQVGATYEFWRSGTPVDADSIESVAVRIGQGKSYPDTDLEPDTQYYYYIRAINRYGSSDFYSFTAKTKNEPSAIIKVLSKDIRDSELQGSLLEPIPILAGDKDTEGSVDYKVAQEAAQRAQAILDEKNNREAAITNAQEINQSGRDSLASSISSLAAGTGEQFDVSTAWYFKEDLENWAYGKYQDGFLVGDRNGRADFLSPSGLNVDGDNIRFFKARIKKTGSPGWVGKLSWKGPNDRDFVGSQTINEPSYQVDGDTTITFKDIPWSGTIDQILVEFAEKDSDDDHIDIDWMAIGSPTPGASQAALQREREARIRQDQAEATDRQTLAAQMRGDYDGDDPTQLSRGLVYEERKTRIEQGKAFSSDISILQANIKNAQGDISANQQQIGTVESNAKSARTELRTTLQADYNGQISSISQTLTTKADNDTVSSLWTARLQGQTKDGHNLFAGFGLGLNGKRSSAAFNVDDFVIGSSNVNATYAFIVRGERVFINDAMIGSLVVGKLVSSTGESIFENDYLKTKYIRANSLVIGSIEGGEKLRDTANDAQSKANRSLSQISKGAENRVGKPNFYDGDAGDWGDHDIGSGKNIKVTGRDTVENHYFDVVPGEKLFFAANIYTGNTDHRVNFGILTNKGNYIGACGVDGNNSDETDTSGSITVPDDVTSARAWIQIDAFSDFGSAYVKNMYIGSIQRGADVTSESTSKDTQRVNNRDASDVTDGIDTAQTSADNARQQIIKGPDNKVRCPPDNRDSSSWRGNTYGEFVVIKDRSLTEEHSFNVSAGQTLYFSAVLSTVNNSHGMKFGILTDNGKYVYACGIGSNQYNKRVSGSLTVPDGASTAKASLLIDTFDSDTGNAYAKEMFIGTYELSANITENRTANDVQTGNGRAVDEHGANKTENRVARAIANQGAFATLDKVTRNNIAAYLESAAITNAYLGYAAVDTLQLKNQAVTFPQSVFSDKTNGDAGEAKGDGNFRQIQTMTINNTGAPATIEFFINWYSYAANFAPTTKVKLEYDVEGDNRGHYTLFNQTVGNQYGDNSGNTAMSVGYPAGQPGQVTFFLYISYGSDNSGSRYQAMSYLETKDNK